MISGYQGIGVEKGRYVSAQAAVPYAMERCGIQLAELSGDTQDEFLEMFVEWFFSGNWVPVEQEERP